MCSSSINRSSPSYHISDPEYHLFLKTPSTPYTLFYTYIHHEMISWASTSGTAPLPALGVLQAWVHRPQALAKCTISDFYGMRALVKGNEGVGVNVGYSSRGEYSLLFFHRHD